MSRIQRLLNAYLLWQLQKPRKTTYVSQFGGGGGGAPTTATYFTKDSEVATLPNSVQHTKAVHDALALSHDSLSDVSANDHHTPYYILVADKTVSAHAQSVSFTSLDLDTHGSYVLFMYLENKGGANRNYRIYFNSDTTDTNYWRQQFAGNGATVTAGRFNTSIFGSLANNEKGFYLLRIMRGASAFEARVHVFSNQKAPSDVRLLNNAICWTTAANVTRIDIKANAANGIGIGSRLILFRGK